MMRPKAESTITFYSSPLIFFPILIGLNRSREAIVFIGGETLSAHSARPWKILRWIVPVRGKCPDG